MATTFELPPPSAFVELPGLRGLRLARVGQADGTTLEVVEASKGVVIPAMQHPGRERARLLSGALRFMQGGKMRDYRAGDEWVVEGGTSQGPHVVMADGTKIVVLREGRSAFDA